MPSRRKLPEGFVPNLSEYPGLIVDLGLEDYQIIVCPELPHMVCQPVMNDDKAIYSGWLIMYMMIYPECECKHTSSLCPRFSARRLNEP